MLQRLVGGAIAIVLTLGAGCAGPATSARAPVSAAVPLTSNLSGTWHGTYGQVAASLYADEGKSVLQINEDGTFKAMVKPNSGANNRAKPAEWTGTVETRGDRVILKGSQSPWPWVTLTRSGDGVLYGVANDPAIEADVMLEFERDQ
jgi:hypothetical protein